MKLQSLKERQIKESFLRTQLRRKRESPPKGHGQSLESEKDMVYANGLFTAP